MYIRTVELTGWPQTVHLWSHRTGRLPPSSILLVHILPSLLPSKSSPCPPSPLPLHCGFSSLFPISLTSANFVALRTCAHLLEGTISRFLTPTALVCPSTFPLAASSESSSSSSLARNWTCLSVLVRQEFSATHQICVLFGSTLLFGGALLFLFSGCKLILTVNLGASRLLCDAPGPHAWMPNLCLTLLVCSPLVIACIPLPFSEPYETQIWKDYRDLAFQKFLVLSCVALGFSWNHLGIFLVIFEVSLALFLLQYFGPFARWHWSDQVLIAQQSQDHHHVGYQGLFPFPPNRSHTPQAWAEGCWLGWPCCLNFRD